MSEPENIVLVYLRRIDDKLDRLINDVNDLKIRMSAFERNIGGVQVLIGAINSRVDRVEGRLDRIEKRLGLQEDAFMETAGKFEDS